jgi:DNA-binding GntR family transcriptional regulator
MTTNNSDISQKAVKRQSYADQVSSYIKGQILSGELRQGDKIVEEKIASEFGVSRTPIREALTRLQAYGLVHIKPRSYAEVVRIGEKEASDIAQVRLRLEHMSFQLLCARPDAVAIDQLRKIAEEARDALLRGDKAGYFEADSLLHTTAADRCGNGQLSIVYHQFESKVQLLRIAQDVPIERLEIYMRQHFDIVDMLEAKRCSAIEELLKFHIVHDLANYDFQA